MDNIDSSQEDAEWHRGLKLVLCDDSEGWDEGVRVRLKRERI